MTYTLRAIDSVDESEWLLAYPATTLDQMREHEEQGLSIDVLSMELDHGSPWFSYYNIRLQSGEIVSGIQGVHIEGIDEWVDTSNGLTAQFCVELAFPEADGNTVINYDRMAALIKQAIQEKITALEMPSNPLITPCHVASATFEASYPTPNVD